jgi:hypothetical protein
VFEDFIGLYKLPGFDTQAVASAILHVLKRRNLNVNDCRGQMYDGAGTISGEIAAVQTKIRQQEARAVHGHFMGHKLELMQFARHDAVWRFFMTFCTRQTR